MRPFLGGDLHSLANIKGSDLALWYALVELTAYDKGGRGFIIEAHLTMQPRPPSAFSGRLPLQPPLAGKDQTKPGNICEQA